MWIANFACQRQSYCNGGLPGGQARKLFLYGLNNICAKFGVRIIKGTILPNFTIIVEIKEGVQDFNLYNNNDVDSVISYVMMIQRINKILFLYFEWHESFVHCPTKNNIPLL